MVETLYLLAEDIGEEIPQKRHKRLENTEV
jgi:hypothetical protein